MSQQIIDFHAHIYPEKIAVKATQTIGKFYDAPIAWHGLSSELLESGKKIGVTKFVIHSVATKPDQVVSINNFILNEASMHPEFIPFATYHQDYEDYEKEINRVVSIGAKGVKMHPDFQHFQIDTPKLDGFYSLLEERSLPIIFHAGDSRYDYSGPKRIAAVLDKHPKLKVIAAHFGGYTEWDQAIEHLVGRDVWFDTSSTLWKLPIEKAQMMIKKHGVKWFLWGSDFPMWDHSDEMSRYLQLNLTEKENQAIYYDNAKKLLGL